MPLLSCEINAPGYGTISVLPRSFAGGIFRIIDSITEFSVRHNVLFRADFVVSVTVRAQTPQAQARKAQIHNTQKFHTITGNVRYLIYRKIRDFVLKCQRLCAGKRSVIIT